MRSSTLAIGAILCAHGAGPALAQSAPQVPTVKSEREFKLEARVAALYDTNSARSSKALALQRGVTQSDYKVTPTLAASVVQPIGQQALFLDGTGGYDLNARNSQLDRKRYAVTGGGMGTLGTCQPIIYGTYSGQQSDLADLDLPASSSLQTSTGMAVSAACGRATGFGGSLTLQRIDTKNSARSLRIQDRTAETLFGTVRYAAPTLVDVSLFYTYTNNEFPNRINPGRPVGDGYWTESLGLRVERKFGSRLTTGASVSGTRVKREFVPPGTREKFTAATYSGDLSYRAGNRLLITLNGGRSVKPSERVGKLFDVSETFEGSARYRLGSRFSVTLGHAYTDSKSNLDTSAFRAVVTDATTNSTSGKFEYRRGTLGSVSLSVQHETRDTNLPIFNYTSTRVGVSTAVSF